MSFITDAVSDIVSGAWDFISDTVASAWNDIVSPLLEEVFGWFGIVDENILIVQKVSVMIHESNEIDVVKQANVKAVMSMVGNGGSFFPWYMQHTRQTQAQIKAFYRFAKQERYVHGLPTMSVKGGDVDYTAIDNALDDAIAVPVTRISSISQFPSDLIYFQNKLQFLPYLYLPWANTLTFTDLYSAVWTDWVLDGITYNAGPDTWDMNIHRVADEALFWITGPDHVVEGTPATFTITSNRAVPAGKSVTANLTYGGTAPGSDYTPVYTAVMTAGNTTATAVVTTNDDVLNTGDRTIIVTLASITNTGAAFEAVDVWTQDTTTTTITDEEGVILTMPSVLVTETAGTCIVPVKMEKPAPGAPAFTVDYVLTPGTALGGGVDFDDTGGTLTFSGTPAGETQNITIPITTPDGDDDLEYFTVSLTNCSEAAFNISQTAKVTITDGTYAFPPASTVELHDTINYAGYIPESTMITKYHWDSQTSAEWRYWLYEYSDGTYAIDPTMSVLSNLSMMPVGILRKDKVSITADKTTEEYKSTKRLLNMLFIDIDDMVASIEENPDIASIDDAFINFAVCPNTTAESVSQVLWLQYYNIVVVNAVTSNSNAYTASFEEQDVQNSIVWTDHSYTIGNLGVLINGQTHEHEVIITPKEVFIDPITNKETVITEGGSELILKKQTAPGVYDKISILNMNNMASIEYAGLHKMTLNKIGDDQFTVPLSHYIIQQMSPTEQMQLYQHMLRLDIYCATVTEIAWYESEAFQNLFQLVMVVITIWTLGAAASVWAAVQQLVINYLILEVVIFLAELTGNAEFAAIVGIVAMISLSAAGMGAGFDFGSAEGLIKVSTDFADNLTTAYDTETQGLKEDLDDLNQRAEARLEELRESEPEQSPITAEFLVALQSVDTTVFPAIKAQYDFDLLYDYDRIIANYHNSYLQAGVI